MIVEKTICDNCGEEALEFGRSFSEFQKMDLCTDCKKVYDRIREKYKKKIDVINTEERNEIAHELPNLYNKFFKG